MRLRFNIFSEADLEVLLAEPQALLCLWYEWSQPAIKSRRAIENWHEQWDMYFKSAVVPLYLLNGDVLPDFALNTLNDIRGGGSLNIFMRGKVVEQFPNIAAAGLSVISTACDKHFGI
jgi:hypothetical protein